MESPAVPVAAPAPVAIPVAWPAEPLEERLRRLEESLAQLHQIKGVPPGPGREAGHIQREPPPPASGARTSVFAQIGKRILAAAAVPSGPVTDPGAAPEPARRPRLLFDALTEARAIYRMFVDPRYRLSLTGRVMPLVLVVAIVFSYYWVPGTSIPVFGWLLNKAMDLVLAYALFKVLGREARRYRETAPDLPPWLRL
jgi:hypothetical protein